MNINLKPYRLLIIDDFAQFRLTLKKMLERKGAESVDQAANAADALKACSENRYDLVFCDYNLGDGQDGQELLEEMHERALLPKSCLFIMVSAEMMSSSVIGALEYRPDAYLGKPFPFEQLSNRLDRLIARNEALKIVYREMEAGEYDKAIAACDRIIEKTPTARFACLRIKSEILEAQQNFDAAREIYDSVVEEQPLLWAMIGIGKLLFKSERIDEALAHFLQMRETFPRQVAVNDWIAQCQFGLGDLEKAEQALQEALGISPKSVARQARLGEVAEQLGHHEIAQKAWSHTVNEGQNSCLVTGENFQRYFDNTGKILSELDDRVRSRIVAESERNAKKMERRFRHDPGALATNLSALAELFREAGRSELSSRFVGKLATSLDNPECHLSAEQHAFIEAKLEALATADIDETLQTRISSRMGELQAVIDEHNRHDEAAREFNRQGLKLIEQKQSESALDNFRQALSIMPDNPTYLLNAAQMVLFDENLCADSSLMQDARDWMQRISLTQSDNRMPLYILLKARLRDG